MAFLNKEQKRHFQEEGYLIVRGLVEPERVAAALDRVWEALEEQGIRRDDPSTWVDQGYRTYGPVSRCEEIRAIVADPLFRVAEELVGEGTLNLPGGATPHLGFPRSDKRWHPPGGHLDGYYTPTNGVTKGTTGRFMLAATLYADRVLPQGGGFSFWPRSHRLFAEYFRTHPIDALRGGQSPFPVGEPQEFTGEPGDVCFWHGWLYHSASTNVQDNIRFALITRFSRRDQQAWKFDTEFGDLWRYWENLPVS